MDQVLEQAIEDTLRLAAAYDGLDELEAGQAMARHLLSTMPAGPPYSLASACAGLAIRMHRLKERNR